MSRRYRPASPVDVSTIGHVATLSAHRGCVNRLRWSADGHYLASGSDDCDVHVFAWAPASPSSRWDMQPRFSIETGHTRNIFGVAFMPGRPSTSPVLVTGAMDSQVRLHVINDSRTRARTVTLPPRFHLSPPVATHVTAAASSLVFQHHGRVKAVEVCDVEPWLFWSCSEDGTVMQFDLRTLDASTPPRRPFISLLTHDDGNHIKHMAISPSRPQYLALACADALGRVYDRRMLPPQPSFAIRPDAPHDEQYHASVADMNRNVLLFVPPSASHTSGFLRGTHCSWHPTQARLLMNYHAGAAYAFDVLGADSTMDGSGAPETEAADATTPTPRSHAFASYFAAAARPWARVLAPSIAHVPITVAALPPYVAAMKKLGNDAYSARDFVQAVARYSEALELCGTLASPAAGALPAAPELATLYANRALALLCQERRGSADLALADCAAALQLHPAYWRVHVRLAKSLRAMKRVSHAIQYCKLLLLLTRDDGSSTDLAAARKEAAECIEKWSIPTDADTMAEYAMHATEHSDSDEEAHADDTPYDSHPFNLLQPLLEAHMRRTGLEAVSWPSDVWPRATAVRCNRVYTAHSNIQTDIKEAVFWCFNGESGYGRRGDFVVCGSDTGHAVMYHADSCRLMAALRADDDVVNCVQPHPHLPVLATSGIESVIRLWAPVTEDGERAEDIATAGVATRMRARVMRGDAVLADLLRGHVDDGEENEGTIARACRQQ